MPQSQLLVLLSRMGLGRGGSRSPIPFGVSSSYDHTPQKAWLAF